jgi:hypothetical protein
MLICFEGPSLAGQSSQALPLLTKYSPIVQFLIDLILVSHRRLGVGLLLLLPPSRWNLVEV